MIENTDHSAQPAQEKQGETRVSNPVELAIFLKKHCEGWAETKKRRLDALFLLALCNLSIAVQAKSEDGFDAQALAEEVGRLYGKGWAEPLSKAEAGEKVRDQWKNLQKLWAQKEEGLRKAVADSHLTGLPTPKRDEDNTGGRGNTTNYKLVIESLLPELTATTAFPLYKPSGTVEYIPEDNKDANWFVRGFVRGFELSGWRRLLYLGINITALLIGLAIMLLMLALIAKEPSFLKGLEAMWICGPLILALWFTFAPFLLLPDFHCMPLPWLMDFDSKLLLCLEGGRKPYRIRAVHFSGDCPFCGGKVHVVSGGFQFFRQLVGRCEMEPRAHIFSFDYVRKIGRPIGESARSLLDTLP